MPKRRQSQDRPAKLAAGRGPAAPRGRVVMVLSAALALAAVVAFWHLPRNEFVHYDDDRYVFQNPEVLGGLTVHGLGWAFRSTQAANWHPLTWLSHMADAQLFGPRPGGTHLVSLLFHLANTLLLFLLLRRLTGAVWRSACVAALFALHPLHVESVAWASERKDVLSGLLFLLTIWAYAAWVRRRGTARYLLTFLLLALGLMAKPILVTVPFVLLLLDLWPLGRWQGLSVPVGSSGSSAIAAASSAAPLRRLLVEKIPFFILAAASSLVTFLVQSAGGAVSPTEAAPVLARLSNAVVAYGTYLWHTIWPAALSPLYPYRAAIPPATVIAALAALAAGTALALWLIRRRPYVAVGWFWYLGMLVPVIGLVQVGAQSMADRYTYLPLIGIFIAVTWGLAALAGGRLPRPVQVTPRRAALLATVAALVLVPCLVLTQRQVGYWHDSVALWSRALEVDPRNEIARAGLGCAYQTQGRLAEAERCFVEVLRTRPGNALAENGLGSILASRGQIDQAMDHYRRALASWPQFAEAHYNLGLALGAKGRHEAAAGEFREALRVKPGMAVAHADLGRALARLKQLPAAIAEYRCALGLDPGLVPAQKNLCEALLNADRPGEAVDLMRSAVERRPGDADLRFCLALAQVAANQLDAAAASFREALRLDPGHHGAQYRLSWLLATADSPQLRNGRQALHLAEVLFNKIGDRDALILDLLAAAEAELGQCDSAADKARRAAALARGAGRDELAGDIEGRLRMYENRRPCRTQLKVTD